jgi:hypothetical protein
MSAAGTQGPSDYSNRLQKVSNILAGFFRKFFPVGIEIFCTLCKEISGADTFAHVSHAKEPLWRRFAGKIRVWDY